MFKSVGHVKLSELTASKPGLFPVLDKKVAAEAAKSKKHWVTFSCEGWGDACPHFCAGVGGGRVPCTVRAS